jgi:hypothetical protein
MTEDQQLSDFLNGKTEYTLSLFRFFIDKLNTIGVVTARPTKSMIAIEGKHKFAYVTQLGKNFIHVVLPFDTKFEDNLCFTKIAQVPGTTQYNHHLRIYFKEDLNDEVMDFIKLAYDGSNRS